LRKIVLLRDSAQEHPLSVSLRQETNWFIDTLQSYIINIVLTPCSEKLLENIQIAEDVDEMTEVHDEFISKIQVHCLLSKNLGPIQNAILSVLEIAVQFADYQFHQSGKRGRGQPNSKSRRKQPLRTMTARRNPKLENIYVADESTDESDTDGDYDADTENLSGSVGSYTEKLKTMREELTRLRIFIVKGLRGISRSGGEFVWEILADHLDCGTQI
jgi:gamma-tubulin complex component 5